MVFHKTVIITIKKGVWMKTKLGKCNKFERREIMRSHRILVAGLLAVLLIGATSASAATIDWTTWTTASGLGWGKPPGSATGMTALGITVNYSGQIVALVSNYPSWLPATTFSGGTVDNPPPQSGGIIELWGGFSQEVETITFSTPVTDPVMAIWSLGDTISNGGAGIQAQFDFTASEPFTIQSGGASLEYGGSSITSTLSNVLGKEGNGTIQFNGTFSSISWTNPITEIWYGFTVGVPEQATPIPEPASLFLLGTGLAGLAGFGRKRLKKM